MITIAFSRGRLLKEATYIFNKAGYNINNILKNFQINHYNAYRPEPDRSLLNFKDTIDKIRTLP